jgi:hypothetical protein
VLATGFEVAFFETDFGGVSTTVALRDEPKPIDFAMADREAL